MLNRFLKEAPGTVKRPTTNGGIILLHRVDLGYYASRPAGDRRFTWSLSRLRRFLSVFALRRNVLSINPIPSGSPGVRSWQSGNYPEIVKETD
jgi:hypothetical protein